MARPSARDGKSQHYGDDEEDATVGERRRTMRKQAEEERQQPAIAEPQAIEHFRTGLQEIEAAAAGLTGEAREKLETVIHVLRAIRAGPQRKP